VIFHLVFVVFVLRRIGRLSGSKIHRKVLILRCEEASPGGSETALRVVE
jgi:hypothetical protein